MSFNGSTGYIRVASSPAVQLSGDLTIELWINVALGTRQTLLSKGYRNEFELTLEPDGRLNLYHGNGTTYEGALSVTGAIIANAWQHVVVTRASATSTISFYVNGVAKGTAVYHLTPAVGTRPVAIGRTDSVGGMQYVNGRLDEVALYPTALTAT